MRNAATTPDGWETDFFDDLYWALFLARDDADADGVADRLWRASGIGGSPKGRLVLDQGCGAGEVARAFSRRGADVLALDTARNLVGIARSHPEKVDWRVLDATGPVPTHAGRPYDLAYNFYSGIGYGGADTTRKFLMRAEEVLGQGRPFLVEIYNGDHLLAGHRDRLEYVRTDVRDGRRWTVLRESRLGHRAEGPLDIPRMYQDWTLTPEDGRGEPVRRSTVVDVMTPAALGSIARAAGFNDPVALDSVTLAPATVESPRVILRFTRGGRAAKDGLLAARMRDGFETLRREPAILDGGGVLTGGECLDVVAKLEAALRTLPPRKGTQTVALMLPRSFAVPLAMMASRVAGYAFCPFDVEGSDARISGMLARLRPAAVIAFREDVGRVSRLLAEDEPRSRSAMVEVAVPPMDVRLAVVPCRNPGSLGREASHVVLTSGSTGRPKAVLLRESGLVAVVDAQVALLGACGGRPGLWALNPSFDASLSDVLCPLLGGRTLAVHRDPPTRIKALRTALGDAGSADVPPSMLAMLDPAATGLSACIFGGERAAPEQALRWGKAIRALQAYGPTEASICVAMARAGGDWHTGTLGRPLLERTLWLREADGRIRRIDASEPTASVDDADAFNRTVLVPSVVGPVEGEILVAGLPLALGYLDDPDMQDRRFREISGRRYHLTGDIVRWEEGRLCWIGRDDRQVKVNGRMVCPEEVEASVGRLFPGTVACCLPGVDGLVLAFEGGVAPEAIRDAVAVDLGPSFRPRRIHPVEALPRGPTGKVDVAALTRLFGGPDAPAD